MFSWTRSRRFWRVMLWVLHALLVVAAVVLLWWLNRTWRLELALLSPFPALHHVWLPLLFLLVYAGAWLGWWFFRLLREREDVEFADIKAAWDDATAALGRAGIVINEVPLFLVLGRPTGAMEDLFAASGLPLTVRGEPRRDEAPLHVFANREAIFVTCEGASLLGSHAGLLAEGLRRPLPQPRVPDPPIAAAAGGPVSLLDAPHPSYEEPAPTRAEAPLPAPAVRRVDHELLPEPSTGRRTGSLANTDEVDRQGKRLRYLCRLIGRSRRPFCSANGLLWLVPLSATDSAAAADEAAGVCRLDHDAAVAGLQVHCPSALMACGLETLPGFADLLRHLPEESRRQRLLGRSFPLAPDLPSDQRGSAIRSGVDWLADSLIPSLVYPCFDLDAAGARLPDSNARLWGLLGEIRARRDTLARLAVTGPAARGDQPPLLRGCYLAATGSDERDQAFAGSVLRQLVLDQNHVVWSAAAVAEESDYRRMTAVGYGAMVTVVVALGVVGWMSFRA